MKRSLGIFLVLIMLSAAFVGCSGADTKQTTDSTSDTSANTQATTVDPYDLAYSSTWTDEQWVAYEEQLDFNNYKFRISITDSVRTPFALGEGAAQPEGQVYDEWRETINQLESDMNIDVEYISGVADDSEHYYAYILSGDNPADFYEIKTHTWFPLYAKNGLVKLNSDEIKNAGFDVNNEKLFYQPFLFRIPNKSGSGLFCRGICQVQ
jgi:hypothetical protein